MSFRLSIITINYNNKIELEKTILSVIEQTFLDFEFIVIDGGSSDGSVDIINKYKSHIHYFISEKDNGIYDAQNKGIKAAKGDYLLFLNASDCFYSKDSLSNLFKQKFSEDIVYGNYCVKGTGLCVKSPSKLQLWHFWYKSTICHQTAIIAKKLFEKHGYYNTELSIVADWEFFLKTIFIYHASYKYVDVRLVSVDVNGISSTKYGHGMAQQQRTLIQNEYFSLYSEDYKLLSEYINHPFYKLATKTLKLIRFFRGRKISF